MADTGQSDIYDRLRSMVLTLKPADAGLSRSDFPHPVFALAMETGLPDGSYLLAAIADGTTSLYFSGGGGVIGGSEHENVRQASVRLLGAAQRFHQSGRLVTEFPKPEVGEVIFYLCTFDGLRACAGLEENLGSGNDEMSQLFFAAHDVIAELRKNEESNGSRIE